LATFCAHTGRSDLIIEISGKRSSEPENHMTTKANRRVLRWPDVHAKVSFTRQYVDRLERQGRFPRRVRLGANSVAWFEDEIDAWLDSLERGPRDLSGQLRQHVGRAAT
jgi:prophage regulatory protein